MRNITLNGTDVVLFERDYKTKKYLFKIKSRKYGRIDLEMSGKNFVYVLYKMIQAYGKKMKWD